jgi:hypothetical protein
VLHPDSAVTFRGDKHERLVSIWATWTIIDSADIAIVQLNRPVERFSVPRKGTPAQFV